MNTTLSSNPTLSVLIQRGAIRYPTLIILGFLHALSFDFSSAFAFSLVGLGGFLWVLANCRLTTRQFLLSGYCFGLGSFGWGLNWVYISMANFGGASLFFAVTANFAVIAYLSLYWLLTAGLLGKLATTPNQRLLLAAPVIALLEWLRSFFLIGFPWLSVGYAWIDTPLVHVASVGGVFLLTAIVVFLIALALLKRSWLLKCSVIAVISVGLWGLSVYQSDNRLHDSPTLNVALVQGNMPVIKEYNSERMSQNLVQYLSLTEKLLDSRQTVDFVVWAESAIPYFYADVQSFLSGIYDLQRQHRFAFAGGMPHSNPLTQEVFNAVYFQAHNRPPTPQFYHKYNLLPFGEYLPFRRVFAFFKDFVSIPMSDFSAGNVVQAPFNVNQVKFSPSICFEAVFGDAIRKNARHANALLNISNDAWFGKSKAQFQHLNIARMRAVENQKPLIRATNNGITAVIAPNGNIEHALPPFTDGVLVAPIKGSDNTTLYARWGDMPWVIVFLLLGGVVLLMRFAPLHNKNH